MPEGCRAVVSFRELPPGSIGRAAWVVAALVVMLSGVVANYDNIVNSSYVVAAAALMVSAPGAAAALAGSAFGGDEILRAPMLARFALQWAAVSSTLVASHLVAVAIPAGGKSSSGWREVFFGWLTTQAIPVGALIVNAVVLAWLASRRLVHHELWHFPRRGRRLWSVIDLPSTKMLLSRLDRRSPQYEPPGLRSFELPEVNQSWADLWRKQYMEGALRRAL